MFARLAASLGFTDSRTAGLRTLSFPGDQRQPGGVLGVFITILCVGLSLTTLWLAFSIPIGPTQISALHLGVAIPLIFLLYPGLKSSLGRQSAIHWSDWLLAILAAATFVWAFTSALRFQSRMAYFDPVEPLDMFFGILALVVIFEATRRTVGMTIVVINLVFMAYALTGPVWPGMFEHRGTEFPRLIEHLYMLSDGMFNFIMGITATFLFTFMMFGVFLRVSGGDRIFTDLALAIAGQRRGGPAKVAVISSALMGMLSGSTVSNVATTGVMTIPLMKRSGFSAVEAAAVETTASLGGALTPPLMGAGVFLMVAFTGVPLGTIMLYSILPALLYFLGLYAYVDVKARKRRLQGLPRESLPRVLDVLLAGGHIFIPIFALVYVLVIGFTPFYASAVCVIAILVVGAVRTATRMNPALLLVALEATTRVVITITALSASAAVIYGVMTMTGLIVKASSIILALSGGSLAVGIILIGLMSYVLGMGLPVTASYVLIAALGATALADMGVSILAAHLIIFWFSQDSTITPPVCMTAFVAARIADAPPMRTGWESVKLAKALYVMPFAFAYSSILSDNLLEMLFDALPLGLMLICLPMIFESYATRALRLHERLLIAVAAGLFFMGSIGSTGTGLGWTLSGFALAAAVILVSHRRGDEEPLSPASASTTEGRS
ncbi:MAG: TRAP transporter fused permease subunit [Burkholderiaceae bacterium]|nr:TRAP transporter fused permease subunit [Burkholderiaceae bacterium]